MNVSAMIEASFRRSNFLSGITEPQASDILNRGNLARLKSEAILRYIGPGELTAIISVFKGKEYPATAETLGVAEAVGWDKQTMVQLMLEYPPLAVSMLRFTIDRLDELQNRYLEICTEQAQQRIARALLRIMKQSGRKTEDGIRIDFPLSRQEIADYTGTTIYTVSRILSAWEKKNVLNPNGNRSLSATRILWFCFLKHTDISEFYCIKLPLHCYFSLLCAKAKTPVM